MRRNRETRCRWRGWCVESPCGVGAGAGSLGRAGWRGRDERGQVSGVATRSPKEKLIASWPSPW